MCVVIGLVETVVTELYFSKCSCSRCKDCSDCSGGSHLTDSTGLSTPYNCAACCSGNIHMFIILWVHYITFIQMHVCKKTITLLQALPLAQQLEAKPQTGHLSGIEAASASVAPVAAATVTAASTLIASGQTADTSSGMNTQDLLKVVLMKCDVWRVQFLLRLLSCTLRYSAPLRRA